MSFSKKRMTQEKIDELSTKEGILGCNGKIASDWDFKWAKNCADNLSFGLISGNTCKTAYLLDNAYKGCTAIVMGTGPSLDKNLETLKRSIVRELSGHYLIFSSPSSYCNALAHGITPDFMVAYDAGKVTADHFRNSPKTDTRLLTHPCIHPDVLAAWNGEAPFWFIPRRGEYHDFLTHLFPYIASIPMAPCVVNTQIQLAISFGCARIILIGCDFGFTNGYLRAKKWEYTGSEWVSKERDLLEDEEAIGRRVCADVLDIHGNEILTWHEMLLYRGWIVNSQKSIEERGIRLLNGTGDGILTSLEQIDFDEFIDGMDEVAFQNATTPEQRQEYKVKSWLCKSKIESVVDEIIRTGTSAIDPNYKPNEKVLNLCACGEE